MCFTLILDCLVSDHPCRLRSQKTTEFSFQQKTISSSGREVLWSNPLHSPPSKTGSVHSSQDGSRMWSVLHDLRRTRNSIIIWKVVLTVHASTDPSDNASTLVWSLWEAAVGTGSNSSKTSYICLKVQQNLFLSFLAKRNVGEHVIFDSHFTLTWHFSQSASPVIVLL